MTSGKRSVRTILLAFAVLAGAGGGAQAQLFGQPRGEDSEVVARMGRLENQIRQLTGMVEELQHRNTQLEQQLRRIQQDTEFRFQEMNPSGRPPARNQSGSSSPPPGPPPLVPPAQQRGSAPQPQDSVQQGGSRRDVFDPSSAPNAPGAPRPLGSMPGSPPPGGDLQPRAPGTPLDLGSLANSGPAPLPGTGAGFPQSRDDKSRDTRAPAGQQAVLAPSGSPRDEFDLAYGAIQRRDYQLAVDGFRVFLANHAGSREPEAQRLLPEANYWMGEAYFQLKQYRDAAETFLTISTDFPNAVKAPDSLLRLGQSLASLGEKETACAALGHVSAKYPRASTNVKRAVEQEQKRVGC